MINWHETKLTVRFHEVDSYQVAWHGHYVAWMEAGRMELSALFGLAPSELMGLGYIGPVVQLEVKYLKPARFGDELTIRTGIKPVETAAVVFISEICSQNGERLATGKVVHALTDRDGTLQFRLPPVVAERVERLKSWGMGGLYEAVAGLCQP